MNRYYICHKDGDHLHILHQFSSSEAPETVQIAEMIATFIKIYGNHLMLVKNHPFSTNVHIDFTTG